MSVIPFTARNVKSLETLVREVTPIPPDALLGTYLANREAYSRSHGERRPLSLEERAEFCAEYRGAETYQTTADTAQLLVWLDGLYQETICDDLQQHLTGDALEAFREVVGAVAAERLTPGGAWVRLATYAYIRRLPDLPGSACRVQIASSDDFDVPVCVVSAQGEQTSDPNHGRIFTDAAVPYAFRFAWVMHDLLYQSRREEDRAELHTAATRRGLTVTWAPGCKVMNWAGM